jgi:hypothetical protein
MAKGDIITEKEKKDYKVYQLLLILNWKARRNSNLFQRVSS